MPDISEFTNKKNSFAIVGASNNKEKYGNKVFLDMIRGGYNTYPINPKEDLIEGKKCYPNLATLLKEKKVDVVITIVPADITLEVTKQCKALGIRKVWMQPGSESEEAIEYCEKNSIETIHDMCIMVERHR